MIILDHPDLLKELTEHYPGIASFFGLVVYVFIIHVFPYLKHRLNKKNGNPGNPGNHSERLRDCESALAANEARWEAQHDVNKRLEKNISRIHERIDKLIER